MLDELEMKLEMKLDLKKQKAKNTATLVSFASTLTPVPAYTRGNKPFPELDHAKDHRDAGADPRAPKTLQVCR